MAGAAEVFTRQCPLVDTATAIDTTGIIHYYQGQLTDQTESARVFTLAPEIADEQIHEAFEQVSSQWLNPSSHSSIVGVQARGKEPRPWIAVDEIDGRKLETAQPELSLPQIRTVVVETADALARAGLYNTTHGALSPSTIWVCDENDGLTTLVDDWGLHYACRRAAGDTLTTPFTPPECEETSNPNMERADVYGLGAIAYYTLTSHPPTEPVTQSNTTTTLSTPTSERSHPDLTDNLDEVIQTALATDPGNRYDSASKFKRAFTRALPPDVGISESEPSNTEGNKTGTNSGSSPGEPSEHDSTDTQVTDTPENAADHATEGSQSLEPPIEDANGNGVAKDEKQAFGGRRSRRAVLGALGIGTVGVGWFLHSGTETSPGYATGGEVRSSPALVRGTIYVGSDDNNVYALDAENGTKQWTYETEDKVRSSPAVVNDTVYIASYDGNLYALNAEDGTPQWTYETGGGSSSPVVVDDTVYIGSLDNRVYALDADDGTKKWSYMGGFDVSTSPAIANKTVYFGSEDNNVYALNADDGSARWTHETLGGILSSPAVVDGTVYVGTRAGFSALNADTGDEQWNKTMRWVGSSPAVGAGSVYFGSLDDNVYALDAADGTEQWSHNTGDYVSSSPVLVDGTIYIGSDNGNLYALDADDGTEKWTYETGGITSSLAVVDGTVYFGSLDGQVYALDATTGTIVWGSDADREVTGAWRMYQHDPRNTGHTG